MPRINTTKLLVTLGTRGLICLVSMLLAQLFLIVGIMIYAPEAVPRWLLTAMLAGTALFPFMCLAVLLSTIAAIKAAGGTQHQASSISPLERAQLIVSIVSGIASIPISIAAVLVAMHAK